MVGEGINAGFVPSRERNRELLSTIAEKCLWQHVATTKRRYEEEAGDFLLRARKSETPNSNKGRA
jgi:hypothetical protein